jgi:hypothetical protein
MGCHTTAYNISSPSIDLAIKIAKENNVNTISEIIDYGDYDIIDNNICKEISVIVPFRLFNYDQPPLYSYEHAIEVINRYEKQTKYFLLKNKLIISIDIWFNKWFNNSTILYSNTSYKYNTIEFKTNKQDAITWCKQFFKQYPYGFISFG